jgi:hypothetical protein
MWVNIGCLPTDGFMNWAVPSKNAFSSGAFYKTTKIIIEIPKGSIAENSLVALEQKGNQRVRECHLRFGFLMLISKKAYLK